MEAYCEYYLLSYCSKMDGWRSMPIDLIALLFFVAPQVPVTVGLEKTIQYFRKELEESGESKRCISQCLWLLLTR